METYDTKQTEDNAQTAGGDSVQTVVMQGEFTAEEFDNFFCLSDVKKPKSPCKKETWAFHLEVKAQLKHGKRYRVTIESI